MRGPSRSKYAHVGLAVLCFHLTLLVSVVAVSVVWFVLLCRKLFSEPLRLISATPNDSLANGKWDCFKN
jgi:cell division protein FtsL